MSVLQIRLLGGLALNWGESPLPSIPGAMARSLLAYLATYRDRPHTRNLLAGIFWPDLPDDAARRRLSQALWQIRSALASHPLLLAEGDTVQLNPDLPVWLDVAEFAGCQAADPPAWGRAVELYRGDFLAGYYDDWAVVERERLREAFLAVLEQLVEGLKARGEYERALAYARRLASEDPLREEAHGEVMRLCHLLGRDSEALQQYALCRQVLADELEAEPSAKMVALANEIDAQAQAPRSPHLPVAARSSLLPLLDWPEQVPLVGRGAERAELARHLERAIAGQGGLLLLAGGAGVGKTRLMQEVARDAAWRGVRVEWGHSCELSAPLPFQPLVEILHDADLSHLAEAWQRELGRLLPDLGLPPPAREPEQERGLLLQALARAFLALAESQPQLAILEDVHWMDIASFEALRVLLPHLARARLLVVATLRPEELAGQPGAGQGLAMLEATRLSRRLELDPLTVDETEVLVQRVLDLPRPIPGFSQRLHAHTAGNPFFLVETLQALVEEGLLYRDDRGEWRTCPEGRAEEEAGLPLPRSIRQSIEQRLARLSPAVRDLVAIAAIIGRQVEFDLWRAAGGCDEGTTLDAAEEMVRRGLWVEMGDAQGHCFVHDTIRQAVYEGMSPLRRRQRHRQVAAALEAQHPEQIEALAHHHRLAQKWPEAMSYALQAGQRAQAVYANQQALAYYRAADAWLAEGRLSRPADGAWSGEQVARWRADLAEKQGQIHSLMGHRQEAEAAFGRAQQMWAALSDWQGEARVLNRWSFLCAVQDDHAGASRYAERALAVLPEFHAGEASDVAGPASDAMGYADRRGLAGLRATSLTHLGLSAWTQGCYDEALPLLEEALTLFEQVGTDLYGLARCLNCLGQVHLKQGALELAGRCLARSLALRQQIGDRQGEAWCWCNQGRTALARGDLAAARQNLDTARAIFAEIQHPYGLDTCARVLAELEQAEVTARRAGQIMVRLPRADAPLGRPLGDDEFVLVTWTVTAAEDARVPGKTARRRQRILRLLAEAQAQGATPRDEDLAAALAVSLPTLRRDMAALRAAGHDLFTRWRKMIT